MADDLLLLAAAVGAMLLVRKPTGPTSRQVLSKVASNPLASGEYSNEDAIFKAIYGAKDAASALAAVQQAVAPVPPMDTTAPPEPTSYNGGLNAALRAAGVSLVGYQKNPKVEAARQIGLWQKQIANLRRRDAKINLSGVGGRRIYAQDQARIASITAQIGRVQALI